MRQVPRLGLDPSAVSESEARTAAREVVSRFAENHAERIGVQYGGIRIGGQRTLWGSCSPRGTLSFNWRLVLAPLEVLDYVVVHELCHLRVPNHSRRFWALVERHRPHWRQQRDWLREYDRAPGISPAGLIRPRGRLARVTSANEGRAAHAAYSDRHRRDRHRRCGVGAVGVPHRRA